MLGFFRFGVVKFGRTNHSSWDAVFLAFAPVATPHKNDCGRQSISIGTLNVISSLPNGACRQCEAAWLYVQLLKVLLRLSLCRVMKWVKSQRNAYYFVPIGSEPAPALKP